MAEQSHSCCLDYLEGCYFDAFAKFRAGHRAGQSGGLCHATVVIDADKCIDADHDASSG